MLDDGEKLVPGFREARALRVWTGVRPLFEDAKAADTDTRDVTPRARAARPRAARRRRALRDDHRRQAHDLPAHGRGDGRRRLPRSSATQRAVHDRRPSRCPAPRTASPTSSASGCAAQGGAPARRAAHLRVRADPAQPARGGDARAAARTTSTTSAASCAWAWARARAASASTARPGSCTALRRDDRRARPTRALRRLPAGALEGRVADPLRRPAAPGAAGRLDLPGRPRRGAPAGDREPTATLHFDAVVIGAGTAGLDGGDAPGRGRRARAACSPRASARRTSRPGRSTCSATRPSASRRPARALRELVAARPDHPYALHRASRASRRRSQWFARRIADGPQPGYRYVGDLERNLLLPTAVGALRPSALVPETMAERRPARGASRCASSASARCATSTPRCAPPTSRRAGIAARAIERRSRRSTAPTSTRSGSRGASTTPTSAPRSPRSSRRCCAADERGRAAGRARACATRTARLGRAAASAWAGRVFEIPTLPPSVPGMRVCTRPCARRCAPPAGASSSAPRSVGAERDGDRVSAVAHQRRRPRRRATARAGSCSPPAASRRAAIALDSDWVTRETVLGLPLRGVPGRRRAAVRGRLPRRAADGARRGGGRRAAPARRGRRRTCSSPAPRCRAPCRGGRARARASRWPAATAPREVALGRGRDGGGDGMSETPCSSELLRGSLDHCVKCTICETACPVSNVTPLFPGPKYVGPQAERYRVADEPSVDASVDYCSGCGICTQVCPQGVKIAEINAQARNKLKRQKGVPLRDRHHHAPDVARPRWARRSRRSPTGRSHKRPLRILGEKLLRRPPRRAGADVRRAALPALGAQAPQPATGAQGRLLPRLRHRVLRAARRARRSSRSSSTTASRSWSPSRTAAGCRCSPAACSTTRARSCCAWRATWRRTCATTRHDHRRQRDELHADAQARGARDPRPRGRPRPRAGQPSAPTTSASSCSSCTTAASCKTDFQPVAGHGRLPRALPAAGPLDRQAGARAARADPGPAR